MGADVDEEFGDDFFEKLPGIEYKNTKTGEIEVQCAYLTQKQINEFDNEFVRSALQLYKEVKAWGVPPHGKGTLHEKPTVVYVITLFSSLSNRMESWTMENKDYL